MAKVIRFIGDIHGNFDLYSAVVNGHENTIQVGDFGIGFGEERSAENVDKLNNEILSPNGELHRFIRGNHDNPHECMKAGSWIPDCTFEDEMMFIGGALSIDKDFRTPGVSWWEDEELSIFDLNIAIELYKEFKPRILVTHDCPEFIATEVMIPAVNGFSNFPSRTRSALEAMYEHHQPEIHIFGHWHKDLDFVDTIIGTRFICLGEFSNIDLEV